jgi:selenocysteine lyase/cysteine desulfurase
LVALAKDLEITIKWWPPPPDNNSGLSLEMLKPLLSPKTRLVTCYSWFHARVNGLHRPIDVKALDVDFYCLQLVQGLQLTYCVNLRQTSLVDSGDDKS